VQPLVPIRHGRMSDSAFTFYRGAAKIMAGDRSSTMSSGLTAQLCGDAHLANFGSYASPDRRQVFDVNDFDWETVPDKHHYYWRQLHDMKGSAEVETMNPRRLSNYASICGMTLAHAHARSADSITISGYLGSSDTFDKAVAEFGFTYADQNDEDYAAFMDAISSGRVDAEKG